MSVVDDAAAAVAAAQKVQADVEAENTVPTVDSVTLNYSDGTTTTLDVDVKDPSEEDAVEAEIPAGMKTA